MTDTQHETTPPADTDTAAGESTSYDVRLVKRPTGDMHNVTGQGLQPVTHGETGEPEQEYALVANVDGVDVTLTSFNAGRLETLIASEQARQQDQG